MSVELSLSASAFANHCRARLLPSLGAAAAFQRPPPPHIASHTRSPEQNSLFAQRIRQTYACSHFYSSSTCFKNKLICPWALTIRPDTSLARSEEPDEFRLSILP